jgi:opacity protein-like surface antigen
MRTILALAAVAVIGVAGAAYATDQAREKTQERVITADQMKFKIGQLGYDVDRIKEDDAAYKARLIDRDSGGRVNATFDAKTGALMHAKLAREEHEAEEREETREDRKAGEQKANAHQERREGRDEHRGDRD